MVEANVKLTVGLPVFNDASGLSKSIPSVLRQNWSGEIRILVVDDGSTDDTPSVLSEFAEKYPNVLVLRNKRNQGRAAARNRILENIETDYIAWIDSDDVWYPDKIRKQFEVLRARSDDIGVLSTCAYRLVWVDTGRATIRRPRLRGDQLRNCLDTTLYPYLWTMLGRTATFREVGQFDNLLHRRQDFDFIVRLLLRGGRIVSPDLDVPLCEYYRTDVGRSAWQIANANRRIWNRHRKVYARYGWPYAFKRRADQHALTARFFEANGNDLLALLYSVRGRLVRLLSGVADAADRAAPLRERTGEDPAALKQSMFGKGVRRPPPPVDPLPYQELKEGHSAVEPESFVLYRILGNDLPPRHAEGQTFRNLEFILRHEPELRDCTKRWIVNRIADPDEERRITELLKEHCQQYLVVPFDREQYSKLGLDFDPFPEPGLFWSTRYRKLGRGDMRRMMMHAFRSKNIYAMNNNGARNLALEDGRARAKWIMPWDGNCFLTSEAWTQIRRQVCDRPKYKYVLVPMARVNENQRLLSSPSAPVADEEPQIIFRRDARECFSEAWPYGRRPKVELFWRLGVPWKSDHWVNQPWDPEVSELSPEAGQYQFAGWVARLSSGRPEYEESSRAAFLRRGMAREDSVIAALKRLDGSYFKGGDEPAAIGAETLDRQAADPAYSTLIDNLIAEADGALLRGPYSVVEKGIAAVGTMNDYWFPAPYWWPNPETLNGRPYIRVQGKRQPGTKLYESGSGRYDRERLQRLCDDTLVLALAYRVTKSAEYALHANRLLRCWFIDEVTRMNPHLKYAEVRLGHNDDHGSGRGVIQSQSFWYLLEAVRLLGSAGAIEDPERQAIRFWFEQYLNWLLRSRQGRWAKARTDFHGAYYELQVAAIAAFVNATEIYLESMYRIEEKMHHQLKSFIGNGKGKSTGERAQVARLPFVLMAWTHLHYLSRGCGTDLWEIDRVRSLIKSVLDRFFADIGSAPSGDEAWSAAAPLCCAYAECFGEVPCGEGVFDHISVNHPELPLHGVRPFWMLGVHSDPLIVSRGFTAESLDLVPEGA